MLKRFLLGTVSAVTLAGSAVAADLPVRRAPVMKAPAPVVAPAFNWTGCYIGGHAGYGWGTKEFSDALGTFADFDVDGALAGGQIGCDYQSGQWVFGVEGQGSWAGLQGDGPQVGEPLVTHEAKVEALWSITGRIGYAWNQSLLYVKGGLAGARDRYISDDDGLVYLDYSNTRWGWTAGGGWEYAFTPNWSFKIEYMYADLGSKTSTVIETIEFTALTRTIDQELHTVKIGLNYRFGNPGAVVARY